ncbi:MAG: PQQ-like beta-propeller repeat protein [Planctomycetes bacterium]|nr:PQQ-like beta-propeller repeat protein [Planctomycetota bacterium]
MRLLIALGILLTVVTGNAFAENWPQWRGPEANGISREKGVPTRWGREQNIRWKAPLPGLGTSSPIVWGDQVILLSAINTNKVDPSLPKFEDQPQRPFGIKYPNTTYRFVVLCLDRNNGRELWRRTAVEMIPHEGHHNDNSFASASPTTDGRRLYVWFGAPGGLFCYDLDGKLLWRRDFGQVNMRRSFGEGASPVLYGDRLIVSRDNERESYILVVDAHTGADVWKAKRDEPSAWSTPLVVSHNDRTQVITNASNRVRSYDLEDGSLVWQCGGQVGNVTPSPVAADGLVFCMSGYRGSALFALPLSAAGDITGTDKIAWSGNRGTPYVPSPLLYDGLLYFNQSNNAILSAFEATTGKRVIDRTRMPELQRIYASPVGAAGRIYFIGRSGAALVIERGSEFKILARNRLDEGFDASPALVGDQLFLRGRKHLYCISSR